MNVPPALLPHHVVSLLLSYLSRLDGPLPPHLVSTPLRQRHHFLGLDQVLDTAQDAAAYLSWPSPSGSRDDLLNIAELLEALPSAENFDPLVNFPTKYSFDGETVYAHAQVALNASQDKTAGLRLIFRWEAAEHEGAVLGHSDQGVSTNADNWKYHDAKPMPFPSNAYDFPREALQPSPTRAHPPAVEALRSASQVVVNSDSDDDAYWDSYGRSSSDDEDEALAATHSRNVATKECDDEKAEEAYWAQYGSIHGTADSTRHSPLPQKRRLHDPSQPVPFNNSTLDYAPYYDRYGAQGVLASEARGSSGYDYDHDPHFNDESENIRYLHRFTAAGGRETSPDGMPYPEAIARRLHNLSPRPSISPSPAPPEVIDDVEAIKDEQLQLEGVDSPSAVSSDTSDGHTLTPPGNTETSAISELTLSAPPLLSAKDSQDSQMCSGLHEVIRGVYRLWAVSQTHVAPAQKDGFLSFVQDALETV